MKIENITSGQVFKNYKELCLELEMEIKTSTNSKKAQIKELERHCKLNKIGHKFYIEEVYDAPKMKVENRGKNESNNVYGQLVQLLITDLLAQCNGHLSISRSKLLRTISMTNKNFSTCGEHVRKLSVYTDTPEAVIYDFYNSSNGTFKSAIETALNKLMDKRVIMFDKVTKVSYFDNTSPVKANQKEKLLILDIEKKILKQLGYEQISDVRVSKHWKLFNRLVKEKLHKESDINYYFLAYDITVHEEFIKEERNQLFKLLLENATRVKYKNELNSTVKQRILSNAEKRHWNSNISSKMGKERRKFTYVSDINKLIELLIDVNADDIIQEVMLLEDEILEDLELDILEATMML